MVKEYINYLEVFQSPLLFRQLFFGPFDGLDAVLTWVDCDETPERVLDRLEPIVAVHAKEVRARQQTLDVLVVGVEHHEDRRHVLVQVFHHGQGHGLDEVVPAVGNDVDVGLGVFLPLLGLLDHRHVAVVVEEDHLEFVVAVGHAGDDDALFEVGLGHGDAEEVRVLPFDGPADRLTPNQRLHIRHDESGHVGSTLNNARNVYLLLLEWH